MQKLNILVLSHLTTNVSSGPNWSVPASVKSLSEIDNVLWINKTDAEMPHWNKVSAYHNIKEFDSLDKLPFPFEHPDIVVFEGFYFIDDAICNCEQALEKTSCKVIMITTNKTKDYNNEENGWSTELDSQNAKSYLIVPADPNYIMEPYSVLRFEYNYEIPENLPHNETFLFPTICNNLLFMLKLNK